MHTVMAWSSGPPSVEGSPKNVMDGRACSERSRSSITFFGANGCVRAWRLRANFLAQRARWIPSTRRYCTARCQRSTVSFYTSTVKGPVACFICERARSFITLLSENGLFDAIHRASDARQLRHTLNSLVHAPRRRFAALASAAPCSSAWSVERADCKLITAPRVADDKEINRTARPPSHHNRATGRG